MAIQSAVARLFASPGSDSGVVGQESGRYTVRWTLVGVESGGGGRGDASPPVKNLGGDVPQIRE